MVAKKIGEYVKFIQGVNPSRVKTQSINEPLNYYDQTAFELDKNCNISNLKDRRQRVSQDNAILSEGDVVISNSLQLATVVSRANAGKILTLNFTKVEFESFELDEYYFLYLFNSYSGIKRQKERELQGTGTIQRIPIKSLEQLFIPLLPIEEQRKIGNIYRQTLQLKSQLKQSADLLGQFTNQILEEQLKEKK